MLLLLKDTFNNFLNLFFRRDIMFEKNRIKNYIITFLIIFSIFLSFSCMILYNKNKNCKNFWSQKQTISNKIK